MPSVFVHQHQATRSLRLPAAPVVRDEKQAGPSPQARLNGSQLREISAQWRQRVHEDPEKARRVADVLEWLAAHRDAAGRAPSLAERLRAGIFGWLRH